MGWRDSRPVATWKLGPVSTPRKEDITMRYKWLHKGRWDNCTVLAWKRGLSQRSAGRFGNVVPATSTQSYEMIVHSLFGEGQRQLGEVRARSDDVANRPTRTTRPCWKIISGDLVCLYHRDLNVNRTTWRLALTWEWREFFFSLVPIDICIICPILRFFLCKVIVDGGDTRQLIQNIATRAEYSGSARLSRLHIFMTHGSILINFKRLYTHNYASKYT